MTECRVGEMRDRLPDYVHGRLGASARAEVEKHLLTCAACREEVALLRSARSGIVRRTPAVDAARVVRAVRQSQLSKTMPGTRPDMVRVRRPVPAAAWRIAAGIALLATGMLGYLVGRRGPSPLPAPQVAVNPVPAPLTQPIASPVAAPIAPATVPLQHPQTQMPAVAPRAEGITFGGGTGDLSASQLDLLMKDLNGSMPAIDTEPESDADLGSGL